MFGDLTAFCLRGIEGRPKSQLSRAQILRDLANAAFHIITTQAQGPAIGSRAPQSDMHVRMFGIAMDHGHPLQRTAEILVHTEH